LFYMENMAPCYIIAINIDALLFHVILIWTLKFDSNVKFL
jgi:hypothetical protein